MPSFCRPILLMLLTLAGAVTSLRAGTWEDANTAFAAGEYARALPLYQEVIPQNGPTAARLYNLGNTHAKLNQPGPAVLCYERAALLDPRHPDIQANLKLARPLSAASLTASPPWWKAPLYWLSLHEWSWTAVLGMISFFLPCLAWLFLTKRPGWLREATPLALGSGAALTLLSSLALQQRSGETRVAILTSPEPVLRLSPFPDASPVMATPPPPGTRVIPGQRHGDWIHLTLPGSSTTGWVPSKDVTRIIPEAGS
jgi:hypothetical protein